MREDDPDWFEDRDNWIYYNPSVCTMEDYPNEDWNAFRGLTYDPLGGHKYLHKFSEKLLSGCFERV
jgi:hypothetical protein